MIAQQIQREYELAIQANLTKKVSQFIKNLQTPIQQVGTSSESPEMDESNVFPEN